MSKTPEIVLAAMLMLLISCGGKKQARPDSALDTGRAFIRASLDGDFKTARDLLINDSANRELFASYENYYNRMPLNDKENFRNASYEINKMTEADDSAVVINYSNSFMKEPMEIRVVRRLGIWMVDFEYIYAGESPAP